MWDNWECGLNGLTKEFFINGTSLSYLLSSIFYPSFHSFIQNLGSFTRCLHFFLLVHGQRF